MDEFGKTASKIGRWAIIFSVAQFLMLGGALAFICWVIYRLVVKYT